MKRQAFKMIAQSSIDEIVEQIDDLKHFIRKAPEPTKNDFYEIANELENDKQSLISQYNNLNTVIEEKWDVEVSSFKETRDMLKEKIDEFLTKK